MPTSVDVKFPSPFGSSSANYLAGGGGVLPYIRRIGMCRPKGFLGLFGSKTGIDFANFGLESGIVFEGTTGT